MCGIAGQVNVDQRPVNRRVLEEMGRRLRHRGPDDNGIYAEGPVGLVHQRLSIVDLSPAGHQPMSNEDGTVWIVFNGEIYNFQELRENLKGEHTFRSCTDTEVILHLYEELGLNCVSKLRGMFAFAMWDVPRRRLLLARDRVGKKPLFYSVNEQGISFASEIKALLTETTSRDIDPLAIHHYLTFQYVPAPRTIFRDIRKLKPGHLLVYEEGKATESAYWTLHFEPKTHRGEAECVERFRALLEESVRLRMISDVPLGAFLSGGVDSSTVVAIMSRLSSQPVRTFSIGFKEEAFNELDYARQVAARFHTEHHEFIVEPDAIDILSTLVRVYDEPFADSSAIPTYYVSQLSRQFVTVALNGDGGDELLAGYGRYALAATDRLADRWLSGPARARLGALVAGLPAGLGRIRNRLERVLAPFSRAYLSRICYFSPAEKQALYSPEFAGLVRSEDSYDLLLRWFEAAQASDLLDQLLSVDTGSYLPDDLLVKVDRATMAHSLEGRSPLLDHHLLEFAATLPVGMKVRNGTSKYLMKRAMRGLLPDAVLDRPKMGFGVPIDQWFRGKCRDYIRDVLLSAKARARGYFSSRAVEKVIDAHQRMEGNFGYRLYALLMLEQWHHEYHDPPADS
jgi:asparagine synthase (glutamine-hydrolysing)